MGDEQWKPIRGVARIWRGGYATDHAGSRWIVGVDFFDWDERMHLYRDGHLVDTQRKRATFVLPGEAVIESKMALYGMAHVRLVDGDRREPLRPVEGSAEKWRADLDRRHPRTSRVVGILALALVIFGVVTQVPEIVNLVLGLLGEMGGEIDWRAPTFDLGGPANTVIGVAAVAAALERGLSMRHIRGLDD